MCSICGMVDFINPEYVNIQLVQKMGAVLNHRGPDQNGSYVEKGIAFQHNRLAIVDIERGLQPMKRTYEGKEYVICDTTLSFTSNPLLSILCLQVIFINSFFIKIPTHIFV